MKHVHCAGLVSRMFAFLWCRVYENFSSPAQFLTRSIILAFTYINNGDICPPPDLICKNLRETAGGGRFVGVSLFWQAQFISLGGSQKRGSCGPFQFTCDPRHCFRFRFQHLRWFFFLAEVCQFRCFAICHCEGPFQNFEHYYEGQDITTSFQPLFCLLSFTWFWRIVIFCSLCICAWS